MTSVTSLFNCSATDVTIDRVRDLVEQAIPESLTLEYKERFTSNLIKSVAAMGNTYGGLILVGVTDQPGAGRLIGVGESTVTQIVNGCHEGLEPPWQPEIIPLLLDSVSHTFVVVVRVHSDRAPRPLLVGGSAPIRLHGRNATAGRGRLAQLFTESSAPAAYTPSILMAPQLPRNAYGDSVSEFMLRSGVILPTGQQATWRPLSERAIDTLAELLNQSALQLQLVRWTTEMGHSSFSAFRQRGLNRSRQARLVWRGNAEAGDSCPVEAVATVALPEAYGITTSRLEFTIDVIVRPQSDHDVDQVVEWRIPVSDLYELVQSMMETLSLRSFVDQLADLAGIEAAAVPQPGVLHLVSGLPIDTVLQRGGLTSIEDAGVSHGARLLADPSIDLSSPSERRKQVDAWLIQIALDAGLRGMERVLEVYHASTT